MRSRAAMIVLALYVLALGILVLWPTHPDELWRPFTQALLVHFSAHSLSAWITFGVLNDAANVVLFLPAALVAVLAFGSRRWWLIAAVGFAAAIAGELAQAAFLPGRTADITDVVFGAIGAFVGVGIGCLIVTLRGRRVG